MRDESLNARVVQRSQVNAELVILRVATDGRELPRFRPGQFAVLGLPADAPRVAGSDGEDEAPPGGLIRRAYSIASSSVSREFMEFYITLVKSGSLTPRLFALAEGDRLWLSPRTSGTFTLDGVPPHKHTVMMATGTGLAPYMSMLRSHLSCGSQRRFVVLHGARHARDLGYRSELEDLSVRCPNVLYVPIVSRPQEEPTPWRGDVGYVQDLWKRVGDAWGHRPTPRDSDVFLCGNPAMVEDMAARLSAEGFRERTRRSSGELHVERYW